MAKPKKNSGKSKTTAKTDAKTESAKKAEKVVAKSVITSKDVEKFEGKCDKDCHCGYDPKHPFKGFFARKGDPNETILTIFKNKKIWGALLAEAIGTMLVSMLLLTIGMSNAVIYAFFVGVAVSAMTVSLSGAHLNPIVTAGMMASRRISAIRGVLYMLAQVVGAWLGFLVANGFLLAGGSEDSALFQMEAISAETFWGVFFMELVGALIIGYSFARAWRYHRKQPLLFAVIVAGGIALPYFLCTFFASYLGLSASLTASSFFIFNPAEALMYQILPSSADSFGELMQVMGMALTAYVIVPIVGGIAGNYLAESTSRLAGEKPADCHCGHGHHPVAIAAETETEAVVIAEEVEEPETKKADKKATSKKDSKKSKKAKK